ncbi:MAG: hypothetical protein ACHQ49_07600 [Elusimicrobiota bacterium]
MKTSTARTFLWPCASLIFFAACAPASEDAAQLHHEQAEAANKGLSDWSNLSSNMMVDKYGPPDRVETLRLVWERRGPWKRIAVWDELGFHSGDRGPNNIEETVAYRVPAVKRDALAEFSGGLYVSPDGEELSARSSSEDRNILLLNLADAIVQDKTTPEAARLDYLNALKLSEAGKASPLMQRLQFP